MDSKEIRQNFLGFFKRRNHVIVPSSSLIPTDGSVLFTTAGMQQFKEYYLGKESPYGKNVASSQKCFRTSDIEEVGDNRHLTFLEMLGNFSFGGYFKKEAIEMALEFLTKKCRLPFENLRFTVFKGDENVPEDRESREIWKNLGIPDDRIYGFAREDNFWGPTGKEGPCGPTTEIHYDLTRKPCPKEKECDPNCQCGRFIEIWNLVFNQYFQDQKGKLSFLERNGVDTGMGLERLTMVIQGKNTVYETDLFEPIASQIPTQNEKARRIIADHIKSSVFLISEGILPSNVERGYVLRRILRRAITYGRLLNLPQNFLIPLAKKAIAIYRDIYPEVASKETDILTALQNEEEKFEETFSEGKKETDKLFERIRVLDRVTKKAVNGKDFFDIFQTYGFPLEMIFEEIEKKAKLCNYNLNDKYNKEDIIREFSEEMRRHQEISRAGVKKKFGGGGEFSPNLHTATHLLHAALRKVLGEHVKQMGSDITHLRLRFDFSHPSKMTAAEIKKVEDLVNQKISEKLEVKKEEMNLEKALNSGALSFFREKYPEKVTVYSIGDFSKEICAGPHVKNTSELGKFEIIKEESSGAGVRRVRAILK